MGNFLDKAGLKYIFDTKKATGTSLGLVMTGYAENGRNYPVELDGTGKMFVSVPWTDTVTSTLPWSNLTGMPAVVAALVSDRKYAKAFYGSGNTLTVTFQDNTGNVSVSRMEHVTLKTVGGQSLVGPGNIAVATTATATQTANGLLSAADKKKLDTIGFDTASKNISFGDSKLIVEYSGEVTAKTNMRGYINGTTYWLIEQNGTAHFKSVQNDVSSDRRKKRNIRDFSALDVIESLGGVYEFEYRDTGGHSYGLIAQKVRRGAMADSVHKDKKGYYSINYLDPRYISLALKAVTELREECRRLRAEMRELGELGKPGGLGIMRKLRGLWRKRY